MGRYTNVDDGGFSVDMAKKQRAQYVCSSCGHTVSKWQGKCNKCNEWNSFEESIASTTDRPGTKSLTKVRNVKPTLVTDVDMSEGEIRLKTVK